MFSQLHLTYNDFARPWQLSFQKPATSMMEGIIDLHHDIFTFLIIILIFVSFILGTIVYRYIDNPRGHYPEMQFQTGHGVTHDTNLEIVWTIIPTFILLFLATPSFALIYALDDIVEPQLTIRIIGRQWYWTYEYPDSVELELSSKSEIFTRDFPFSDLVQSFENSTEDDNAKDTIMAKRTKNFDRFRIDLSNSIPIIGFDKKIVRFDNLMNDIQFQRQKKEAESLMLVDNDECRMRNIYNKPELFFMNYLWYPNIVHRPVTESLIKYANKLIEPVETIKLTIPGFNFNSYIIPTEDLFPGAFRLLEVDRRLVLPVNTNIRILVTSYDVIHSWTVPAFGIKVDAMPGRLNEFYLNVNFVGVFYGQCSEICGVNHGFMPIKVEVTTLEQFKWWFLQTSLLENPPMKFRSLFSVMPTKDSK